MRTRLCCCGQAQNHEARTVAHPPGGTALRHLRVAAVLAALAVLLATSGCSPDSGAARRGSHDARRIAEILRNYVRHVTHAFGEGVTYAQSEPLCASAAQEVEADIGCLGTVTLHGTVEEVEKTLLLANLSYGGFGRVGPRPDLWNVKMSVPVEIAQVDDVFWTSHMVIDAPPEQVLSIKKGDHVTLTTTVHYVKFRGGYVIKENASQWRDQCVIINTLIRTRFRGGSSPPEGTFTIVLSQNNAKCVIGGRQWRLVKPSDYPGWNF